MIFDFWEPQAERIHGPIGYSSYESFRIEVLNQLTEVAKQQLADCTTRDFNVGVHCWDTWAYNIALPPSIVAAVAGAGCSISFTLYPMREPDGTPKIDADGG